MAIFFIIGLVIGSFLNVCIYRIPQGESVIFPSSRCPHCGYRLALRDLVPVLSFLLLKGRCRRCGRRISPQYLLVELGTGILFQAVYLLYGFSPGLLSRLVLMSALLVVAVIDSLHYRIPNKVVGFIAVAGVGLNLWTHEISWIQSLGGALAGGGILGVLAILSRGGMGEGDIKLAAATGLFLGPINQSLAIFLAAGLGSLVGVVLILTGRKQRREPIAFGPFMAIGTMAAYLLGDMLWSGYLYWAGRAF